KTFKLILLFAAVAILHSCSKKSSEDFESDFSLYREYITSFTSGVISTHADIGVGLAFDKKEWQLNQELDSDYYSISPSVAGKVIYLPGNMIAFKPEQPLKSGTEYRVTLHLSEFIDLPKELKDFNFIVKTLEQDFMVTTKDLQSYSKDVQFLNAELRTSDYIDAATAKKLVRAEQDGRQLAIRFDEKLASQTEFPFIIDSIQRQEEDSNIKIIWNGKPFDINRE